MTTSIYQLHDKATRGEMLTTEEEAALAAWYARQDQEEDALLTSFRSSFTADALQAEIENALTNLQAIAQQVREQLNENEALRRDITALTQQLAQRKTLQPA